MELFASTDDVGVMRSCSRCLVAFFCVLLDEPHFVAGVALAFSLRLYCEHVVVKFRVPIGKFAAEQGLDDCKGTFFITQSFHRTPEPGPRNGRRRRRTMTIKRHRHYQYWTTTAATPLLWMRKR